jgi:hypothetical protein
MLFNVGFGGMWGHVAFYTKRGHWRFRFMAVEGGGIIL